MPGALPVTALGDPDAEEGVLERGAGRGQGGTFVVAALEGALGLATGLVGPLEVDLGRHVRELGHDDDLVRADLDEAARDRERLLRATLPEPELARAERRQ